MERFIFSAVALAAINRGICVAVCQVRIAEINHDGDDLLVPTALASGRTRIVGKPISRRLHIRRIASGFPKV